MKRSEIERKDRNGDRMAIRRQGNVINAFVSEGKARSSIAYSSARGIKMKTKRHLASQQYQPSPKLHGLNGIERYEKSAWQVMKTTFMASLFKERGGGARRVVAESQHQKQLM